MQTTMSVEVDRPIKEVFDYTIKNVAEWSIIVVKDEVIDEKTDGVGSTFRVTTEEKGRRADEASSSTEATEVKPTTIVGLAANQRLTGATILVIRNATSRRPDSLAVPLDALLKFRSA